MHWTSTAIATAPSRPAPRYSDELLVRAARSQLEQAEWRVVRAGLGLMAWSMTVLLLCAVCCPAAVVLLTGPAPSKVLLFVVFPFLAGIPLAAVAYLAGVVMSLIAPRRARLSRWIAVYVAGWAVGLVLLLTAFFWDDLVWRVRTGLFATAGSGVPTVLAWLGAAAVMTALLAYCLYLAGIARRFGARRLAVGFVAFFLSLFQFVGLIAFTKAIAMYWGLPCRYWPWPQNLQGIHLACLANHSFIAGMVHSQANGWA